MFQKMRWQQVVFFHSGIGTTAIRDVMYAQMALVYAGGLAHQPAVFPLAFFAENLAWLDGPRHTMELGAVVQCLGVKCTKAQLQTMTDHMGGTVNLSSFLSS